MKRAIVLLTMIFALLMSISAPVVFAADQPIPAPPFTLTDVNGNEVSLESLRGQIVVLNFWKKGCLYCLAEMPGLNQFAERNKDRLVVLTITVDDVEAVKNFVQEKGWNSIVALVDDGTVMGQYQIQSVPTTYIVDQSGQLVYGFNEMFDFTEAGWYEYVDALIAGNEPEDIPMRNAVASQLTMQKAIIRVLLEAAPDEADLEYLHMWSFAVADTDDSQIVEDDEVVAMGELGRGVQPDSDYDAFAASVGTNKPALVAYVLANLNKFSELDMLDQEREEYWNGLEMAEQYVAELEQAMKSAPADDQQKLLYTMQLMQASQQLYGFVSGFAFFIVDANNDEVVDIVEMTLLTDYLGIENPLTRPLNDVDFMQVLAQIGDLNQVLRFVKDNFAYFTREDAKMIIEFENTGQ